MKTELFEFLKRQFLAMTYEEFTVENVQSVFTRLSRAVTAFSSRSNQFLDEWILRKCEELATKTSSTKRFIELVQQISETRFTTGQIYTACKPENIRTSTSLEVAMAVDCVLFWSPQAPF
ncbi:MAG: hypothetical protein Q4C70_01450 [Planctomycetia bacterium]|nr:hypothetical protein [Planctomycetia bacterium]